MLPLILLAIALFTAAALARDFVAPRPQHARAYPAHEERSTDKITIAIDPYENREKTKIFEGEYLKHDLLPIHLIVSNDGTNFISLAELRVELVTTTRSVIPAASVQDLYRRLAKLKRRGTEPMPPLPVPLPRRPRSSISDELAEEIERSRFQAKAVEPESTQDGFFFFDVRGIERPLDGARLVVTGVRNGKGEEMMFFEIPLDSYFKPAQRK
jgi:hypothetical protein